MVVTRIKTYTWLMHRKLHTSNLPVAARTATGPCCALGGRHGLIVARALAAFNLGAW